VLTSPSLIEDIAPFVSRFVDKKMREDGEMEKGVFSAGHNMGLVRAIPTCRELLDDIMSQTEDKIREKSAQLT
jgi:hypothetical protein